MPFFILIPSGSSAPTCARITFIPFLAFGAPHTISSTSLPISTLHRCRWSESGCGSHSFISPIIKFVALIIFSAESYSFPAFVIASAMSFSVKLLSKSI